MACCLTAPSHYLAQCWFTINTLRPRQNGRRFPDDIFKCIFLNKNVWISIKISLKFVPKGPINNIPALVQIMAWRRSGDKPLSEPMIVGLPTHICVTRPQWVNEVLWHPFYIFVDNQDINPQVGFQIHAMYTVRTFSWTWCTVIEDPLHKWIHMRHCDKNVFTTIDALNKRNANNRPGLHQTK